MTQPNGGEAGDVLRQPRDLIRRLLDGERVSFEELDSLQATLLDELYPLGSTVPASAANDARFQVVLDVWRVIALLEPDDPSHQYTHATLLRESGRLVESADAYLAAAQGLSGSVGEGTSKSDSQSSSSDEDDEEWYDASIYFACRCLVWSGQPISAAFLLSRLKEADWVAEIRTLLEDVVAEKDMKAE